MADWRTDRAGRYQIKFDTTWEKVPDDVAGPIMLLFYVNGVPCKKL